MQVTLLQTVFTAIITPIIAQMTAMIGPVCNAMQPVALAGIGIVCVFWIWDLISHAKTLQQVGRQMFTTMMFYSLLWSAQYTQYVSDLFLDIIPTTVGTALGASGGTPAAQLDALIGQALTAASQTYEAMPSYSLKSAILSLGVILFVVAAVLCIAFCFLLLVSAAVINVLTLVIGPVFLACATMPWTRKFASGWLSVLVGGVVTQLMMIAFLRLMIGGVGTLSGQMATTAQATNSNSIMMLWGLAQIGVLLWLFKEVAKKVPELAQTIGGGVYHGSQSAMNMTFGAAAVAGAVGASMVTGGVGGAVAGARATGTASGAVMAAAEGAGRGAAQGYRYAAPAGRSLSRRRS